MSVLYRRLKTMLEKEKFSSYEIYKFNEDYRLGLLKGAIMGYQLALKDIEIKMEKNK